MNSNCGVYCIRCKVNNKAYIGSSVDIKSRWSSHKSLLRTGKHTNKQLQEDYNKYGADSFLYLTLINCKSQMLLKYENMYILLFNTRDISMGYNIANAARPLQTLKTPHKPRNSKKLYGFNGRIKVKPKVRKEAKPKVRKEDEMLFRELYKVQCIETGEIVAKKEICDSGKDYTNLNKHLQGKRQSYRGYHWRYVYR